MTADHRSRLRLFGTGFLQVFFVGANTVFIAHKIPVANFVTALAISYVWTHNVKKTAFGNEADAWAYSVGAACGSVAGSMLAFQFLG